MLTVLKYLFITIVGLLLIGISYEQYSRWKLERSAFAGERFLRIGDGNIHYVQKGKGAPTVVFASGMGSNSTIWKEIQDTVSTHALTISYDRSGLFLSDQKKGAITNHSVSAELEEILRETNCPKPYLLVLHSMAGIYLRPFIQHHKADIAGIILMESAHPDQLKRSSKAFLAALKPPPLFLVKTLTATGLYRTVFSFNRINPEIPITHPIHQNERDFFYRSVQTLFSELDQDEANFNDAKQYGNFENIPLTVITGTSNIRTDSFKDKQIKTEYMKLVDSLHRDFLKLSSQSKLVQANRSGHVVQVSQPGLIVREIIGMLKAIRKNDIYKSL